MRRSASNTILVAALLTLAAAPASAITLEPFRGHVGLGYARVFIGHGDDAPDDQPDPPGGSLSVEGGLDYPVAARLRVGANLGYHLLGSRTVERGSLVASLDYSAFTAALLLHWEPGHLGPVTRLSAGPAIFNGHVELSTSGGGALFADLARGETAAGAALDATVMRRTESPVRIGLELGTRIGFLPDETWTLGTARLVFHY